MAKHSSSAHGVYLINKYNVDNVLKQIPTHLEKIRIKVLKKYVYNVNKKIKNVGYVSKL